MNPRSIGDDATMPGDPTGSVTAGDDVRTVTENGHPATRDIMSSTAAWGSPITAESVNLADEGAVRGGSGQSVL